MVLLVITLSIPSVQTRIAKKVTTHLNESYGTDINIHRMGLNWKGEADLRGVYIADHHGDTLIFSEEIQTNILSIKKLIDGNLDFGYVDLTNAKLYVKTYKGEDLDNLLIFSEKFETGKPSTEEFKLFSENVALINSHVKITDENLEVSQLIDYQNVNLNASDFSVIGPNVKGTIESLSLDAGRGYNIQNLSAEFSYSLEQIKIEEMLLETNNSFIKGAVILNYGENGLANFVNDVVIDAQFDEAIISTNDLNTVFDEFGSNININLQGKLDGTLNNFRFNNARLSYSNTSLRGNFRFKNILDSEQTYKITALQHSISSNYFDLRRLMPQMLGTQLPEQLRTFGNFTIRGDTELFGDLLVTDTNITTAVGNAVATFEMGNIHDFSNAFYRGEAVLTKFDLGKISGSTSLGNVDADISFDGRGFTAKTVNTRLKGTINSINFEGYTYKNIAVSGDLKDPIFDGKLSIDDPNLKLDFSGLIDISKEFNQYDFEASIEYAELNKLNLFKRDSISVFAGRVVMDMEGTNINDAVGNIEFLETFYQTEYDDYYFDDFLISSFFTEDERTIEIKSPDIIDGKISGKFLVEDIPNLFQNSVGSIYTNYIANEVTTDQYIDYEFEVYNKIVELFVPQLQLGENTRVKGSVFSDESKFKLDFRSPELLLYENYLGKVNIQLDNDNPLYNAYISVDSLYTGAYNLSEINIINKTLNDTLYMQSSFVGGKQQDDLFDMSFYHTINPEGKSVVGIKKSKITYKDNDWYLNRDNDSYNKITFDNSFNQIKLDSLSLRHNNELIRMAGILRDSTYTNLKMDFTNVDIGKIAPEIDSLKLKGNINGRLNFLKKQNAFYPSSEIVIEDVAMNEIPFGDLNLRIGGNTDLSKFTINSSLVNDNLNSFTAKGSLGIDDERTTIDLDVDLDSFNVAAFSPFGGDVITNMRGLVSGDAKISGNVKSPDINGKLSLDKSGLKIPYLNLDIDLANSTEIGLSKNTFKIKPTFITDTKYNTTGVLAGNFTHDNFGDWAMDLSIETDRMLVLDTPPDEDALYYGTAFISGQSYIKGPIDELVIDVFATTEEGTSFKIPISDATSIGDDSFIHFLSPEEKQARISGETVVNEEVKGLSLNFELDINEKAEVEVVVDKVNNSTLKGRGAGILLIEINTLGKFKMWGDFLVIEGKYDFRYGGLVDKTIDVLGGGNITWDGNPTRARLDLTAKYVTEANPAVLLDNPSFNRKIDVEVLVDLTGEILQPELDFRIQFPRVSSTVKSELEYKLQDKEQRQTQALFLVSTGSFQSDAAAGQNALSTTLAERVNSLVRDIFSSNDKKFVFLPSVSTSTNNESAQTEYQIGVELSTRISERILINGKVGVPVGGANESAVAGDIEVQWLVNEDGSLRINFFNRQADLQFIGEDQIFEQGGGIEYSVDFDTFKELMLKLFNKKLTVDEELPVVPDDNTFDENLNGSGTKEED